MSDIFGHVSVGIIIIILFVFNGSRRPLNVALIVYFIIYISMTSLQPLQQAVLSFMPDWFICTIIWDTFGKLALDSVSLNHTVGVVFGLSHFL